MQFECRTCTARYTARAQWACAITRNCKMLSFVIFDVFSYFYNFSKSIIQKCFNDFQPTFPGCPNLLKKVQLYFLINHLENIWKKNIDLSTKYIFQTLFYNLLHLSIFIRISSSSTTLNIWRFSVPYVKMHCYVARFMPKGMNYNIASKCYFAMDHYLARLMPEGMNYNFACECVFLPCIII